LVFAYPSEHCAEGRKDTEDRQLVRLPVHPATLSYSGALRRSPMCHSGVASIADAQGRLVGRGHRVLEKRVGYMELSRAPPTGSSRP
jgi:hypothetical protein